MTWCKWAHERPCNMDYREVVIMKAFEVFNMTYMYLLSVNVWCFYMFANSDWKISTRWCSSRSRKITSRDDKATFLEQLCIIHVYLSCANIWASSIELSVRKSKTYSGFCSRLRNPTSTYKSDDLATTQGKWSWIKTPPISYLVHHQSQTHRKNKRYHSSALSVSEGSYI